MSSEPHATSQSLEANKENYFFKEVTQKNVRNAWLIGVGVLIIVGVSWALYFLINAPHTTLTGTVFTFVVGPVSIGPGERNISNIVGIPQPKELLSGTYCALHWFKFALVDSFGNDIPMEEVYVEQLALFEQLDPNNTLIRILASSGSEAAKPPTNLGTTYAVKASTNAYWGLKWNFFNIWGGASNSPIDVYIKVSIRYTALKATSAYTYVEWDMLGMDGETTTSLESTFNVPGTGGTISKEVTGIFFDDTTIVLCVGNLHIGAVNISIFHSNDQIPFATSKVTYAANGYIASVERVDTKNTFIKRDTFRLVANYDNSRPYENATALMQVYRTVPTQSTRFIASKRVVDSYFDLFFDRYRK